MPSTISLGSSGPDVKRLQRALARALEWNPWGPITGDFDASLQISVESFQTANGLTVDGICGPATWAKVPSYREASPTVQSGSEGPVVAWLQQVLHGDAVAVFFNAYNGPIDGIFGPLTESSVKSLQAWAGKPQSGVVDDDMWFTWMTPGSAQQLRLEYAAHLLDNLPW